MKGTTALAAAPEDSTVIRLEEVTVTATRHEESISKVPVSVAAFSQEQMDAQGVKQLDDLVRLTPGLNLTRNADTGANQIAIRGISSAAGAATTGIYIDDVPIQVRNLGFGSATAFPGLFDLERVEVLRGPQGTLFGAGSEGGTIRFIQTDASLTRYSGYARAEGADTQNGAPSYEAGAAFGGPIIDDRLGFRVSAFYRRDGGYIDQATGTYTVLDPSGSAYGKSVAFDRTGSGESNVNWDSTTAFRAALKFAATDSLTISPSVFYQKLHVNDGAGSTYWLSMSNTGERNYVRPFYVAGDAATDPALTPMDAPTLQQGDDEFTLSALNINWNFGGVQLVSNTSYFRRNNDQWYDFTRPYVQFYLHAEFPNGDYPPPGYKTMTDYVNAQRNFVQELRLQSDDPNGRVAWVVGAFFSHDKQSAGQPIYVNFTQNSPYIGFGNYPGGFAVAGGAPYGPGSTALANFLGINNGPNSLDYTANWQTIEEQLAGFAQADFKLTQQLKLTAGVRFSHDKLNYNAAFGGPETNGSAPFGLACVPNTGCATPADVVPVGAYAVGTGPFTPSFPSSNAASAQNATTPKVGLSYQIDDDNMVYATAAKGFRPAGASLRVPTVCQSDLATFGYLDAQGKSTQPLTYGSDSVWSYELGSKNRLFDGRLVLDGSVYEIKWKNIQTDVGLPDCGYDFVDNLANATSRGFDLALQARPFGGLTLGGAIGYNKATFDSNASSPSGVVIYSAGSAIPNAGAPWTGSLSGEYDINIFQGHNFYLRADWTRTSELPRTGALDPSNPKYDPLLLPVPAYAVTNVRLGMRVGALDASVFVNNAFDANPLLLTSGNHGTYYDPQDWTASALRPRMIGVTLTYRN
jgi:outer membrane receptor protein involved in Fe transport